MDCRSTQPYHAALAAFSPLNQQWLLPYLTVRHCPALPPVVTYDPRRFLAHTSLPGQILCYYRAEHCACVL
jgi:hypothetical protein